LEKWGKRLKGNQGLPFCLCLNEQSGRKFVQNTPQLTDRELIQCLSWLSFTKGEPYEVQKLANHKTAYILIEKTSSKLLFNPRCSQEPVQASFMNISIFYSVFPHFSFSTVYTSQLV
jgi:hypothetical protein